MNCQEIANDLATAYRKRALEQIAYAGYIMALESNSIAITEERLGPYADALTQANKALNRVLWQAFESKCIAKRPGKPPVIAYDANKKCDDRCRNARGMECVCKCFGAFHGANVIHL